MSPSEEKESAPRSAFTLRDYRNGDDDAIVSLNRRSSMHSHLAIYVDTTKYINVIQKTIGDTKYDAKAREYEDCIVLVAERGQGDIIGVVNVGIKSVRYRGKCAKVGFLYGMRVNQEAQGQGVGGKLLAEVERLAVAKGCCRMILTGMSQAPGP